MMPSCNKTYSSRGSPEVDQRLLQDPEYQRRRIAIEHHLARYLLYNLASARAAVTEIPVVVHIVYSNPTANIRDAQVQSQIDALNRDYRLRNTDSANTPGMWKGLLADARIQFALATVDPQGNATTGITRTATTPIHLDFIHKEHYGVSVPLRSSGEGSGSVIVHADHPDRPV